MMRSMYSGVSGLRIHQTKMDVIGNNIANVNTVGFKSSRVTFSEVFSQTIQGASGASENTGGRNPMQIGLGSSISSVDIDMGEGAAQRTDNPLDLKIEGDGFFVVSDITGNKFTRAGAFRIDEAGNLVNPEGLNVMGWKADPATGEVQKGQVQPIQILNPVNLYSEPTATSNITLSGNININDTQLSDPNGVPFTANFYDSLGYRYTAEYRITNLPVANANQFTITLTDAGITDANGNVGVATGLAPIAQIIEFDPATGKIIAGPDTFDMTNLVTPFSTFNNMEVDFGDLTLFAGNTTLEAISGDINGIGSGNQAGSISGFEVGGDGKVIGRYTNGQTKLLGQIVVAAFQNPAGLQKVGSNLFIATTNSGDFDGLGQDITSRGGSFNSGVLEMSNVDLSREFTEMITTQRGFQANSRIITSSDELLQELVNLKR
ncbi:flagellar hook protein FlgE [Petrocella sp. FN5]|uniref:flagellar hook protein FlgE n=1 Tax=Petrocella sp. FN5 TaxID=3032002 RepID=UPI0023DA7325|nr:flagellar hook protein FlgE [Petrocella sp. FN5]MDF1616823.1 flagellar hook protein FlgE [Petrocella sp. FN5]